MIIFRAPAVLRLVWPVILLVLFSDTGLAGEKSPDPRSMRSVTAVRAKEPITVDGLLSESSWQTEGFSDFTQTDPFDGQPATEKTTVWVTFDRNNLYVAALLEDSAPGEIAARLGRRDEELESDWFYFGVDPYHDLRSGFFFAVNPSGSIIDGTITNDEETDSTWDGIWHSAVRTDGRGWAVELQIPFSQLRFESKDGQVWGVNFRREIKRKNETDIFAWIPKEESGFVSRFAELHGLKGMVSGCRIEAWPFAVSRAQFMPAEPDNPFRTGHDYKIDAGLDLKGRLSSNLTLDVSVNPDFGQVEVDPAVINISDQETYYKEKRPFFIEGAGIFDFGRGGPNVYRSLGWSDPDFFYSRRIGRSPRGDPGEEGYSQIPEWTTILSAAKITGKVGRDFNVGLVSALTEREYALLDDGSLRSEMEVEPFSHYAIARGLKEFGQGRNGLGFIATSVLRDFKNGDLSASIARSATALAIDGWTFLGKERAWALAGWMGMTAVHGSTQAMTSLQLSPLHYFQRPDADWVEVDEDSTSLSGWAGRFFINKQKGNFILNAALGVMSPGFEANDLGYHTRGDLINGHIETGYRVLQPGRLFREWSATVSYYRNYDFGWNRVGENFYLDAEAKFLNYWKSSLNLNYETPKYSHYLTRGGPMAFYPAGASAKIKVSSDDRKAVIISLSGHYRWHPSGGYNCSVGGQVTWKPRPNISLSAGPGYTFRYSEGQWVTRIIDPLKTSTYGVRYVLSDITQKTLPIEIRANWTFTPKLSLQVYLQPYLGTGDYWAYKELQAARTFDFDYYGQDDSTIAYADGIYTVDPDGPGPAAEFSFRDPDFNLKSLRGTAVLRWEYRPGSMLYLVWTQRRADTDQPGEMDFWNDLSQMLKAPGENIFLIKFSYRFEI